MLDGSHHSVHLSLFAPALGILLLIVLLADVVNEQVDHLLVILHLRRCLYVITPMLALIG